MINRGIAWFSDDDSDLPEGEIEPTLPEPPNEPSPPEETLPQRSLWDHG
jgi:hypothetical protein